MTWGTHSWKQVMAREWRRRCTGDHVLSTATRLVMGAAGLVAGVLAVRTLPDLLRYLKLGRT